MKKILAIILAFGLIFCLCACGNNNETIHDAESKPQDNKTEISSEQEATAKFEVTVTDTDGNTVKGVMVQLCKDTCVPAVTNEEGVATFNAEITDGYKLSVMSCPEGYEYTGDAEIYLDEGETSYTLEITKK